MTTPRTPVPRDDASEPDAPPVLTSTREIEPTSTPTPEFIDRVTLAIRGGASPYVAAEWCGISRAIFKRWLRLLSLPKAVVTPAGFEPAISTLKGLRPRPG